jgi:F0F1-type ATP synthase alpha subunit
MQEDRRLARRIAAFLPVDLVAIADGQVALAARLDGRIESASRAAVVQNLYSS